jgi:hypothetical protein
VLKRYDPHFNDIFGFKTCQSGFFPYLLSRSFAEEKMSGSGLIFINSLLHAGAFMTSQYAIVLNVLGSDAIRNQSRLMRSTRNRQRADQSVTPH